MQAPDCNFTIFFLIALKTEKCNYYRVILWTHTGKLLRMYEQLYG